MELREPVRADPSTARGGKPQVVTYQECRAAFPPFFSVCIPQYNRSDFLIELCKSLTEQTFRDFEVCISDDGSTDGRQADLIRFLHGSGLAYAYRLQQKNS